MKNDEYTLIKITDETRDEAVAFIEANEANSIALMGRLLDGSWKNSIYDYYGVYRKTGSSANVQEDKQIVCVIMRSKAGLIQHCIKNITELPQKDLLSCSLKPVFKNQNLYCIMGEKKATEFLLHTAKKYAGENLVSEIREYLLLLYNPVNLPENLLNIDFDFKCEKCSLEDKDALFDLQKQYDIAEVLPKEKTFDPRLCRCNLEFMLKNQIIYGIKVDGKFVAKAGTNAIGKNYYQLGGVFTEEKYRAKGMAQCLVSCVSRKISESGKKAALFVRTDNVFAKKAYRKAGFVYENDYLIVYYKKN